MAVEFSEFALAVIIGAWDRVVVIGMENAGGIIMGRFFKMCDKVERGRLFIGRCLKCLANVREERLKLLADRGPSACGVAIGVEECGNRIAPTKDLHNIA